MFVPFAILMMPLVKQTAQMGLGNRLGVILLYLVFYMPMNILLYTGYLKNYTGNAGRSCFYRWGKLPGRHSGKLIFPMMSPMHATVAIFETALWQPGMT